MRLLSLAAATALLLAAATPNAAYAQGTAPGGAVTGGKAAEQPTTEKPARRARTARPAREPTVGQMAARERQRKCGVEWREAKAGNTTGGLKWPQYWSKCNARLKGNSA